MRCGVEVLQGSQAPLAVNFWFQPQLILLLAKPFRFQPVHSGPSSSECAPQGPELPFLNLTRLAWDLLESALKKCLMDA